jgi:hypothetical protein
MTNWIQPGANLATAAVQKPAGGNVNPLAANVNTSSDPTGMIVAPAVALMVAALWKLLSALSGVFVLTGLSGWLGSFAGLGNVLGPWGSVAIFSMVLFKIIPGLLILFGGYQMLQRRSYGWAIAAGIISIISCSLIGFPAGVWALIVLARDDVKSAFGGSVSAAPLPPQTAPAGRGFAAIAGWVIVAAFILLVLTLVSELAVAFVPELRSAVGLNRTNISGGQPVGQPELTPEQLQQAGIVQGADGEFRKNLTQSFPFNADGRFSLDNVNGRIEIHGWNSNAVVIAAVIHGRTGEGVEAIKVNIDSNLDRANVHTEQPRSQAGFHWSWRWLLNNWRDNASVDYTVQVPAQARLANISSVNGHVEIDGVTGDIAGSTVNGAAQIQNAAGKLKLSTVNGRITADMSRLGEGQSVALDAVNGRIELAVPENTDAKFSVSTVNGGITSEFPSLQPKKEFPVGNNLNGTLGNGAGSVKVSTVNGSIKFLKSHTPNPIVAELPDSPQLFYEWHGTGWVAISNHDFRVDSPVVSAAKKWLLLVDAGDYAESWKETATFVQSNKTEADWSNYLTTNRTSLGKLISRQLVASIPLTFSNGVPTSPAVSDPITVSPPVVPDGPYVFMQFESSFAEKKDAKEKVTFSLEKDGQWRAASYFIK